MSADSFAFLRKNAGEDIGRLAEEHFKHDLQDSDRDALKNAESKIGTHATVGSLLGLGLGLFLALRLRGSRTKMFNAFRAAEKPTHVRFADGREGRWRFVVASLLVFPFDQQVCGVFRDKRIQGHCYPILFHGYCGLTFESHV